LDEEVSNLHPFSQEVTETSFLFPGAGSSSRFNPIQTRLSRCFFTHERKSLWSVQYYWDDIDCMDQTHPSWKLGSRCLHQNGVPKCAQMSCSADKKLLVNGSPCDPSAETTAAVLHLAQDLSKLVAQYKTADNVHWTSIQVFSH
jgi:hypothetical protein